MEISVLIIFQILLQELNWKLEHYFSTCKELRVDSIYFFTRQNAGKVTLLQAICNIPQRFLCSPIHTETFPLGNDSRNRKALN